jgi:hypothetical protein
LTIVLTNNKAMTLSLVLLMIQDTANWQMWEIITNKMDDDDATWARSMGHLHQVSEMTSFINEMFGEFGFNVNEETVVDQRGFLIENTFTESANQEAIAAWMFQSMENGRLNACRIIMAVSDLPVVGHTSLCHAINKE